MRGRARPAREYAPCEPARQTPNRERQTRLGELSLSPRRPPSPRCLLTWRADSTCDCVFRGCLGQLRTWALGSPTVCPCVACASALHMREKARSSNIRCSLNENVMHAPAFFRGETRDARRARAARAHATGTDRGLGALAPLRNCPAVGVTASRLAGAVDTRAHAHGGAGVYCGLFAVLGLANFLRLSRGDNITFC